LPSRNAIHAQLRGAGRLPLHRPEDIPCRSVNLIVQSNQYISIASVIAPSWVPNGKKSCGLEKELLLMWIVRVALDRPYTFIVLALMILILSVVAIARTPTDIFPSIDIPVIAVDWTYTGLNPEELEGRLTSVYERVLTTTVDNIQHLESTTVNGQAIVKVFLQPGASLDTASLPPGCRASIGATWSAKVT
jgi:hypothetical protein